MADEIKSPPNAGVRTRYRWPWFVLGAVVLAVLLAFVWMSKEIERTRRQRELTPPPVLSQTSPAATSSAAR
jgi:hypothetical protein